MCGDVHKRIERVCTVVRVKELDMWLCRAVPHRLGGSRQVERAHECLCGHVPHAQLAITTYAKRQWRICTRHMRRDRQRLDR